MTKTLSTRVKQRIDSYANWHSENPLLLAGEIAVVQFFQNEEDPTEVTATKIKIGDGEQNFDDLPYLSGGYTTAFDYTANTRTLSITTGAQSVQTEVINHTLNI